LSHLGHGAVEWLIPVFVNNLYVAAIEKEIPAPVSWKMVLSLN
jgi:hypothetical protein